MNKHNCSNKVLKTLNFYIIFMSQIWLFCQLNINQKLQKYNSPPPRVTKYNLTASYHTHQCFSKLAHNQIPTKPSGNCHCNFNYIYLVCVWEEERKGERKAGREGRGRRERTERAPVSSFMPYHPFGSQRKSGRTQFFSAQRPQEWTWVIKLCSKRFYLLATYLPLLKATFLQRPILYSILTPLMLLSFLS